MLGIYYTNAWDAQSQPFMSTKLRTESGGSYPIAKVFPGGVLSQDALAKYGIPRLTGSFAYAMLMANAAVSVERARGFYCQNVPLTDCRLADRCPSRTLRSLLGRRYRTSLQKREEW